MGCDIHLFTEKKRTINGQEKWINIDNWKLNPYYGEDNEPEYELNPAYRNRDYSLFSILADVRNYANNNPISKPKGLPKDVCDGVKKESDRWDVDGHSHSYLSMKEIYDYFDKNKNVKYSGLVDSDGEKKIDSGEMPEWWCQGSSNDNHIYREWSHENTSLKSFIETLEAHFKDSYYNKEDAELYRIVFWFDN